MRTYKNPIIFQWIVAYVLCHSNKLYIKIDFYIAKKFTLKQSYWKFLLLYFNSRDYQMIDISIQVHLGLYLTSKTSTLK